MRQHSVNFAKYLLAGGFVTILDWSFFALFSIWLSFNYLLVGGLGFGLGVALNYYLCITYIYQSGARFEKKREEITAVYIVGGIGLLLHELLLLLAHEAMMLSLMLSKVFATAIVLFWNFGARNFYVFAERRQ